MPKSLAVLNVEDSKSDSDLIARLLKKAGYDLTFKQVETAAEMNAALKKRDWDVIIADYSLPQFDGKTALALLQKSGLDIPFIAVSGTIGEETAVGMMKAGAHDYLMKDNLTRLVPAVERELEQAQVRRERKQALEDSETRFRAIFDLSPDAIVLIDPFDPNVSWPIIDCNSAACLMNGYRREELVGRSIDILNVTSGTEAERSAYLERLREEGNIELETFHRHKNGTLFPVEVSTAVLKVGQRELVIGIDRDITERKGAEEALRVSEEKYRMIVETSAEGMWVVDKDWKTTYVNPAMAAMLGYTENELLGHHPLEFVDQEEAPKASEQMKRREKGITEKTELRMRRKDGTLIWAYGTSVSLLDDKGEFVGGLSLVADITERKQAEESLLASEKRFRSLTENSADAITLLDAQGFVIYDSPSAPGMLGYGPEEWIGQSLFELIHPDDLHEARELLQELIETTGARMRRTFRLRHKNNSWRLMEAVVTNLLDDPGVKAIVINYRDVTERKQAEEAVHTSEKRFRAMIEHGLDSISLLGPDGTLLWESPSAGHILGYVQDEFIGRSLFDLIHPQDLETVGAQFAEIIQKPNGSECGLFRLKHSNGSWRWMEVVASNLLDEPGVSAIVVNYRDVTERKQAEQELHDSEQLLRELVDNIEEVFWMTDPQSKKDLFASPAAEKIWGHYLEDVDGFVEIIQAEDKPLVETALAKQERGEKTNIEYRITRLDGSVRWIWDRAFPIFDASGNLKKVAGVATDITERKYANLALAESEARYRQAIAAANAIPYSLDYAPRHYTFMGEGITKFTGSSLEEVTPAFLDTLIIESNMLGRFKGMSVPESVKLVSEGQSGILWQCEHHIRSRTGEEYWFIDSSAQVLDEHNIPKGSIGILQDITERKLAEQVIRENEARYRSLFDDSPVSLWEEDFSAVKLRLDALRNEGVKDFRAYFASHPQTVMECLSLVKIVDMNKATLKLFGAKTKTDLSQSLSRFINNDSDQLFQNELISLAQGNTQFELEGVNQTLDGRQIIVRLSLSVMKGYEDSFSKVIVSIVDITAHIQAEKAIRESEKLLREAQAIAGLGSYILDIPSEKWIGSAILNGILGIEESYIHSVENWIELIHPDWRQEMSDYFANEVLGKHMRFDKEYKIVRRNDGAERWVLGLGELEFDTQNQPVKMRGTIQDITERKQAEDALQRSLAEITHAQNTLQTLSLAAQAAQRAHTPQAIYQAVGDEIKKLGYDMIIFDLDPKKREMSVAFMTYAQELVRQGEKLFGFSAKTYRMPVVAGGYYDQILSAGKPVLHIDATKITAEILPPLLRHMSRQVLSLLGGRQGIYAALVIEDKPQGILIVLGNDLGEADLSAVNILTAQVSIALENARLFQAVQLELDERRLAEIELKERTDDLELINSLNEAVNRSESLDHIFKLFGQKLQQISRCNPATFYLLSPDGKNLVMQNLDRSRNPIKKIEQLIGRQIPLIQVPVKESTYFQRAMRSKQGILTTDPKIIQSWIMEFTEANFPPKAVRGTIRKLVPQISKLLGIRSTIAIPLISDKKVFGLFDVSSTEILTEKEFGRIQIISNQLTAVIVRKQSEQALQKSEERFRALIANAGDLIVVISSEGVIQYASPSSERILGYTPEESIGKNFTEWVHRDDLSEVLKSLASRSKEPGVALKSTKARGRHKNGSWRILDALGTSLLNEPAIQGIVLNIRDITERELTEEALRVSESQFRAIFEGAAIGIALVDASGHPVKSNSALQELLGYAAQELRSMVFTDYTHPDDVMTDWNLWQELIAGKRDHYQIEKRYIHKDGHILWVKLTSSSVPSANGKILFGVGMVEDITDRKKAEAEIKYQLSELEALYENGLAISRLLEPKQIAQRMVEVIDQKLDWHHAAIRLYDAPTDRLELIALNTPGFNETQIAEQIERINQTVNTPNKGVSGWVIRHAEAVRIGKLKDDPRYFESYTGINSGLYVPIKSVDEVIGSITIESEQENAFTERDEQTLITLANQAAISFVNARLYHSAQQEISERKRMEEMLADERNQLANRVEERTADLSRVNSDLARAMRVKDEFLASMSHELRTPLTGILGLSEALQLKAYGELNDRQSQTIKNIEGSGRHLLELINDILDLSKIEAGKLELQLAPCSLADICQASLQLIKGMAQQKHQLVHYSPPAEPIIILADARRLKQLLVNLLSNAIKFSPQNGELGLEIETNESEREFRLIVWDKGIGIKPEDMPKLFKPFSQIDSSLAREYAGTGLGLSLARRLTELHNGGIEVESVFGEGSRFIVILPWSPPNTAPLPNISKPITGRLSNSAAQLEPSKFPLILLADDNEMVLQIFADFLETKQCRVIKTRSGAELLEQAAELHPDVILVDIQMPGMDGLETIRRIRSHKDPLVAKAPVVAVTALAMPGDRERCLQAGANEYMSKPLQLRELAAVIQKQIGEKE